MAACPKGDTESMSKTIRGSANSSNESAGHDSYITAMTSISHAETLNQISSMIGELKSEFAQSRRSIEQHAADIKNNNTEIQKLNTRFTIAATVVVTAGIVAGFFLGSSLSDIMQSIQALTNKP